MSKKIRTFIWPLAMMVIVFTSCKKENTSSSGSADSLNDKLKSGSWKIARFIDSGEDETSRYSGFKFSFGIGGDLMAVSESMAYSGNWSVMQHSGDDVPESEFHFTLDVQATGEFVDINDDWHVVSQSDSKIELEDVSGGNGGTDYLTFERNS